jgi:hypothetical protein
MPRTLSANYARNVSILKENLKRGMDAAQANKAIDGMEAQFKRANLYGPDEELFINDMRAAVVSHFTNIDVVLEANR